MSDRKEEPIELPSPEWIVKAESQRRQADAMAKRLLRFDDAEIDPQSIIDLLDWCDVPSSVLALVEQALGIGLPQIEYSYGLKRTSIDRYRLAVGFEGSYQAIYGVAASVQAVAAAVFDSDDGRRQIKRWRERSDYKWQVEKERLRKIKARKKVEEHGAWREEVRLARERALADALRGGVQSAPEPKGE